MDKESMVHTHNGVSFSHREEQDVVRRKMDGTGVHRVKGNKPDSERQVSHVLSHMQNLRF
jgi:ribulose-5-phosphate 4-epimerase/fuculose-1-phosphate aldolase